MSTELTVICAVSSWSSTLCDIQGVVQIGNITPIFERIQKCKMVRDGGFCQMNSKLIEFNSRGLRRIYTNFPNLSFILYFLFFFV